MTLSLTLYPTLCYQHANHPKPSLGLYQLHCAGAKQNIEFSGLSTPRGIHESR